MLFEREMHDSEKQMKLNTSPDSNPTAKKVSKKTRSQKDPEKHLTPEEQQNEEIAQVHKLETNKKSKKSSLDRSH